MNAKQKCTIPNGPRNQYEGKHLIYLFFYWTMDVRSIHIFHHNSYLNTKQYFRYEPNAVWLLLGDRK